MKRTWLTAACALVLTAVLARECAGAPAQEQQAQPAAAVEEEKAEETEEQEPEEETVDPAVAASGSPWIDASAAEALTEDMELSPRDNYYLYVNYDYLMRHKNGEEDPNESYEKMLGDVKKILEDEHAENHNVELSQQLYKAYVDAEARTREGAEPLRSVIEDLRSLSSL